MASNQLATAKVTIGVITAPLTAGLKTVKSQLASLTQKVQNITVGFSGFSLGASIALWEKGIDSLTAAIQRLVGILPKAAFASNDMEMAMHRVKVIFQEAKGKVVDTINELTNLGYARGEVTGLAADMGLMMHGMGKTEKESADLTAQLLKLGAEASIVHGIELPEFMNKLEAALAGSNRALHRMGVFFTPLQVQMEALRMAGQGTIAMTEEQQLQWARLSLIMKQLSAGAGQAAWAHKTLGGQFRETQGRLNGLLIGLGDIVKPIFVRAFMAINDVLKQIGTWLEKNKKVLQEWATLIVDKIVWAVTHWREAMAMLWESIKKVGAWIWQGIKDAFASVWDSIVDYGVAGFTFLGEAIGKIFENLVTNITSSFENMWSKLTGQPATAKLVNMMEGVPGIERIGEIVMARKAARGLLGGDWGGGPGMLDRLKAWFANPAGPGKAPGGAPGAAAPLNAAEQMKEMKKLHMQQLRKNLPFIIKDLPPGVQAEILRRDKARQKREAAAGKKQVEEDGGEPTPRLPEVRQQMARGGPAAFVGIAEFAKKIQLEALGDQDEQLGLLSRIAHSTEFLAQLTERQQVTKQAFAVAAGPK